MKKILMLITVSFLLFSCGKKEVSVQEQKKQARKVPVMIETVKIRSLNRYIPISGRLEGAVDMVLSSETNGKVTHLYKTRTDQALSGLLGRQESIAAPVCNPQSAAGSFNSPVADELDGLRPELGKVFHRFDSVEESQAPRQGDGGVAQRRKELDAGRGTHPTGVLSKGAVPNPVQLVLNAPVVATKAKQLPGIGP